MKWFVIEIATRIAVELLVLSVLVFLIEKRFRVGYQSGKDDTLRAIKSLRMTQGACRTASADTKKTEYPPIVYALDVDLEEATDVPSVNEMAYWLSRTNATASGGWVPVGGKEAAQ